MLCPYCKSKGRESEVIQTPIFNRCYRCLADLPTEKLLKGEVSLKGKGKVMICSIHNRKSVEGADIHLFAVGKPKGTFYFDWWDHTPGLAPSRELVTFTKEYNRTKGRKEGWFERYTERLLDEWSERKDFMKAMKKLRKNLDSGKNVAIACYCPKYKRDVCHLSILGELLEDMGYIVEEVMD
uniref:DUF488 domain-containing protein n=1 Tax=Bacillus phage Adastra TaxID=3143958 RepID=A0AAU8BCF3_9CAUD